MREFFDKLKRIFGKTRRQRFTAVAVFVSAGILLAAGVFAYFNSSDMVTNRLTAIHGHVAIQEPLWDSEGQYMAKKSEPGMQIPKNPYGVNDGDIPLYIRLTMTIKLGAYNDQESYLVGNDSTDGEVGVPTAKKRLRSIVNAIWQVDAEGNKTPLITLNDPDDDVKNWSITCNNPAFVCESDNKSGKSDELLFYFYYTAGDVSGEDPVMRIVEPENGTAELFQRVDIPIYKRDFLGVFDQKYYIILKAEGIPAESFDSAPTIARYKSENNENNE